VGIKRGGKAPTVTSGLCSSPKGTGGEGNLFKGKKKERGKKKGGARCERRGTSMSLCQEGGKKKEKAPGG